MISQFLSFELWKVTPLKTKKVQPLRVGLFKLFPFAISRLLSLLKQQLRYFSPLQLHHQQSWIACLLW